MYQLISIECRDDNEPLLQSWLLRYLCRLGVLVATLLVTI